MKIGSSGFGFGDSVPSEALSFFYPSEISLFAVKVIEILGREEKSSTLFSFIFIFLKLYPKRTHSACNQTLIIKIDEIFFI